MSQPYVGQILIFGGNFAPAGWMTCQGQLLPISEFETLFNLIGTTSGGDGQSTFSASPIFRGARRCIWVREAVFPTTSSDKAAAWRA